MATPHALRFLVTAGNTRERIDDVRDWGNIFTGNTGFEIAKALAGHGEVDLVTSNRTHLAAIDAGLGLPHAVRGHAFTEHAELVGVLDALVPANRFDAVFMTAAVSDYRPAGAYSVLQRSPGAKPGEEVWTVSSAQAGKIKSTHAMIAILGEPTPKVIDMFRTRWRYTGLLFKFKLEVGRTRDELVRIGQASRRASGAEFLVANTLDMVVGEAAGAYLLSDVGEEFIARPHLAERLAAVVIETLARR